MGDLRAEKFEGLDGRPARQRRAEKFEALDERSPRPARRRRAEKFEDLDGPRCIFPAFESITSCEIQFHFRTFIPKAN